MKKGKIYYIWSSLSNFLKLRNIGLSWAEAYKQFIWVKGHINLNTYDEEIIVG